jgi:hypothetical protein
MREDAKREQQPAVVNWTRLSGLLINDDQLDLVKIEAARSNCCWNRPTAIMHFRVFLRCCARVQRTRVPPGSADRRSGHGANDRRALSRMVLNRTRAPAFVRRIAPDYSIP